MGNEKDRFSNILTGSMKNYKNILPLVAEILMSDWDPIGIKDEPHAQKEYDSIALQVVGMLSNGKSLEDIAGFLESFVRDNLCLQPEAGVAERVAKSICGFDVSGNC